MKRALLLLLLMLAAPACMAQASAIHHCVSANGTPVFTDQPCDSVQAIQSGAAIAGMRHACPATRKALRDRVAAAFGSRDANALAGLMLWDGYPDAAAVQEVAQLGHTMQRPFLGVIDGGGPQLPPSPSTVAPTTSAPAPASSVIRPRTLGLGHFLVRLGGLGHGDAVPLQFNLEARAGCFWLHP